MNTPTKGIASGGAADSKRIPNTIMHNCKRKVCRIYDAGSEVCDRYTIAFKGYKATSDKQYGDLVYPYLACSVSPYHSFGQHGEASEFLTGKHLGKRVSFDSLNDDVRRFILSNI